MMRLLFILCFFGTVSFGQEVDENVVQAYQAIIQKADNSFEKKDFSAAMEFYSISLEIMPTEQYPKDQIDACREYMKCSSSTSDSGQYKKLLAKADEYYLNCELEKAKQLYERAHKIKPSDSVPTERLKNIEAIQKSYNKLKQESEIAYSKKSFLQALSKLRAAKTMYPCSNELDLQEAKLIELTKDLEIDLQNDVQFARYMDYTMADSVNSIEFHLVVTNNSKEKIPDLGVSSRSENLNFYINGELSNPVSLYNGLELMAGEKVILPGKSATYYVSWTLTPDSGIITHYGNEFTIQWEYCGIKSAVKTVNIEKKTVR